MAKGRDNVYTTSNAKDSWMENFWFDSKLKSERRSMKFNELPNELAWNYFNSIGFVSSVDSLWICWADGWFQYIGKMPTKHTQSAIRFDEILIQLYILWILTTHFSFFISLPTFLCMRFGLVFRWELMRKRALDFDDTWNLIITISPIE